MRYGPDIVKEITEELYKSPIVRNVCIKVGIHSSTFYRWMGSHVEFHKLVEAALYFGRKNITDAAESVVIGGIQQGEFKAAAFWLTHNEERYMNTNKAMHNRSLDDWLLNFLKMDIPDPTEQPTFDKAFEEIKQYEKDYEPQLVQVILRQYAELFCGDDKQLVELFKAAYASWENDKKLWKENSKKFRIDPDEKKNK